MNKLNLYTISLFSLWLLFALTACSDDDSSDWKFPAENNQINNLIEEGSLLNKVVSDKNNYTLYFETDTLSLSTSDIVSINEEPDKWRTTVRWANQKETVIPSLGTSIDNTVTNIVVNPSGFCPLAAFIHMNLPAKGGIKTIVHGKKNNNNTIERQHQNFSSGQDITLFGLYENYTNQVDLIFTDKEGNERVRTRIEIPVEALNISHFPKLKLTTSKPEKMEPGMNLVNYPGESAMDTSCPYMVDSDGEIRWILLLKKSPGLEHLSAVIGLQRLKNGNFISGDIDQHRVVEIDMLGNLVKEYDLSALGYTAHHETMQAKNGNYLITVSKKGAVLSNGNPRESDFIIELDPSNGKVLKEWDIANMLDTARYNIYGDGIPTDQVQTQSNWLHNNAVLDVDNESIVATSRFQGIFKYNKNGGLDWVISPHKYWRDKYKPYLLTPLDKSGNPITDPEILSGEKSGDDFDWSWGVHTPVLMPNGNYLVFDNGYYRNYKFKGILSSEEYSRAVEYHVDETNRTVQQVWEFGKELGRPYFSLAMSSVQYLPETGNILFCPSLGNILSGARFGGRIVEVEPVTKEIVYELELSGATFTAFHRVLRMPLYPD